MNDYFYRVWIPLNIATLVGIVLIFLGHVHVNYLVVFLVWFLLGPIGVGVGFHRLLAHRQFKTYKLVEYIIATLGTLAAYSPIAFFISNHVYHHKHSDTEKDPSSPLKGFWESFFMWRMRRDVLRKVYVKNYCFKIFLTDSYLKFLSRYYDYIIYTYAIILTFIGIEYLLMFFLLPTFIEHLRLNLISSLSHLNVPFSYRNYDTNDTSQNNYVFGILSMGFGWHNNHHRNQRELINTHNWWELDVEGLIGKVISKNESK